MIFQPPCSLASHVAHQGVHKLWQHPWLAESKERVPMIRHYNKRAEIDALLLNSERESTCDNVARCFIKSGFLWKQRLCNEECCWCVAEAVQAKVPGVGV